MASRFPIWDNHFHLDPNGRLVDAVREFERAGGTHMMVVHKPYHREGAAARFNRSLADHVEQMETTLALAERARKETGVKVFVALSPHPAEFTKLLDAGVPPAEAEAVHRAATEAAADHVRAGRAVALGEVGRPHWSPVPEEVMARANALMQHAFETARDVGCAVQVHAETATPESFADLRRWVDKALLPPERVVKHYSTPIVDTALNQGLWPSVLVGKDSAETALQGGTRFLMETDYMDDPRYPGAVLGPKTVPKRTKALVESGLMTEEQAWVVHAENPAKVYGVEVAL